MSAPDRNARRRAARRAIRPPCLICGKPLPIEKRRVCSDACRSARKSEQYATWRAENAESRGHYEARWRAENREWLKTWTEQNRESVRARKAAAQRRRRQRMRGCLTITARDLERLRARCRGACMYCGASFLKVKSSVEHVLPLSRGGADGVGNLAIVCLPCNQQKREKTLMEWRMWRARSGLPRLNMAA